MKKLLNLALVAIALSGGGCNCCHWLCRGPNCCDNHSCNYGQECGSNDCHSCHHGGEIGTTIQEGGTVVEGPAVLPTPRTLGPRTLPGPGN